MHHSIFISFDADKLKKNISLSFSSVLEIYKIRVLFGLNIWNPYKANLGELLDRPPLLEKYLIFTYYSSARGARVRGRYLPWDQAQVPLKITNSDLVGLENYCTLAFRPAAHLYIICCQSMHICIEYATISLLFAPYSDSPPPRRPYPWDLAQRSRERLILVFFPFCFIS